MENLALLALCVLTLAAMGYVHHRLPYHTPDTRQLRIARAVLLVTGAAFGWLMARIYGALTDLNPILIFLTSMGIVHVPAAAILFIKRQRPGE